jgi:D-3-phosphoglycerate dehydrogenase
MQENKMLTILVADKLSPTAIAKLEGLGAKVNMNPDLSADDLPGVIADYNVLIVRSTKVTAGALEAGRKLELVIRAGAEVNTIDLEKASNLGISVANCPGKNADAVAELAMGLIIAADRRIVDAASDLRDGKWRKKEYQKAAGLKGRTLGVIGLGSIGGALAKLGAGMGMKVIAWSRSLTEEKANELGIGCCASADEVAQQADAISVHLAVKPETKGIINAEFLSKMKDGAIFVNAARGEIVDHDALKKAIEKKGLRVGLDVFADEPTAGEADFEQTELAGLVACTPHIGASTDQAAEAIAEEAVRIVEVLMKTGRAPNTVNIRQPSDADVTLVVRYFNKVGVIASVLEILREENINVEETENFVFTGDEAAVLSLKLDKAPSDNALKLISERDHVMQASLK